ncbi:hypothetical protein OPV22_017978 [Ensete ventricosum]|uniref:Uncharacterized protein n=1 Tax=Ensete ventricosum TaxID=4639 RepID=A0AAV8R3G5_ENSVE|nr:hypothetical protein OPV22_017978 [Ensete ventricosum]
MWSAPLSRLPFNGVMMENALARALQEQERAYAMLRMNGVDCSDYGSYGYEEEEVEEGVGDEPGQVIEDDAGNIEGSDYTRTLSIPMILMLTMRHSQGRCRILRSRVSDDHDDHGDNSQTFIWIFRVILIDRYMNQLYIRASTDVDARLSSWSGKGSQCRSSSSTEQ